MINTTIQVDVEDVKQRLGVLSDQSGKVIARAVNRSYITGKNAIAKEAKKNYLITQKDVNNPKTLNITKARPSDPVATLAYTGEHENLYHWNHQRAVSPGVIIHWSHGKPNTKVYRAAVKRGGARHKLMGKNKPFLQKVGENGFVGLFRRKTEARDAKLESVFAPAIPQILKNEVIVEQFTAAAGPMLQKRLEHEIDVVLKGVTK